MFPQQDRINNQVDQNFMQIKETHNMLDKIEERIKTSVQQLLQPQQQSDDILQKVHNFPFFDKSNGPSHLITSNQKTVQQSLDLNAQYAEYLLKNRTDNAKLQSQIRNQNSLNSQNDSFQFKQTAESLNSQNEERKIIILRQQNIISRMEKGFQQMNIKINLLQEDNWNLNKELARLNMQLNIREKKENDYNQSSKQSSKTFIKLSPKEIIGSIKNDILTVGDLEQTNEQNIEEMKQSRDQDRLKNIQKLKSNQTLLILEKNLRRVEKVQELQLSQNQQFIMGIKELFTKEVNAQMKEKYSQVKIARSNSARPNSKADVNNKQQKVVKKMKSKDTPQVNKNRSPFQMKQIGKNNNTRSFPYDLL